MDRHEGELGFTGGRETESEGHGMEAAGDFWGEPIHVYPGTYAPAGERRT